MGRAALLVGIVIGICGCGSSASKEEAQAYQALQPKPQTAQQKQMLESITKNAPPNAAHAGVPAKP